MRNVILQLISSKWMLRVIFNFQHFYWKKKQRKLNFGNGNHEYRCGVPKMSNCHKRNIFYNQIPFYINNYSFYSFKEHKYKLSDIIWFIREVNKSVCFLFLNTWTLNKKTWESRKTGLVGRQSTGLQQRSTEGQEPDWQMQRLCRINTRM